MKFGGTTVGDALAFKRVAEIVQSHAVSPRVVIVSAMSGVTDALLTSVEMANRGETDAAINNLSEHFERHLRVARDLDEEECRKVETLIDRTRREIADKLARPTCDSLRPIFRNTIVAFGEYLSAHLLTALLRASGVPAHYVDARSCIITDEEPGCAAPLLEETEQHTRVTLVPVLEAGSVPVLGGFIGATLKGTTTTLGRGGSDYTAALVGAAIRAREIQIWTDVDGVLTADPRVVPSAYTVARLSYAEASELAYFGAKVLHPKTIHPATMYDIPLRICNSRTPDAFGTLICAEPEATSRTIKAIAHKTGVTTVKVTSGRFLGAYGFLRRIFEIFDRYRTVVDVVCTSEVSLSLSLDDISALPSILRELQQIGSVEFKTHRAVVCVVGEGLSGAPRITAAVFDSIKNIPVSLISQGVSSSNLTFVVDQEHVKWVVTRLHERFFESRSESVQETTSLELHSVVKAIF
jgi:aspartate kinase